MFKTLFKGSDIKYRKLILVVSIIVIICFILAQGTFAAEQTSKQGLNKTKKVYHKFPITNDNQNKVDPWLLSNFKTRLSADSRGVYDDVPAKMWKGGLPSIGNVKIPVILIDFPDYPHSSTESVQLAQSKFFGNGNPDNYPYESLRNYYLRSSYGKLNITGNVLGWYRAQHPRNYYKSLSTATEFTPGNEALIIEAIKYYDAQGHNFAQYDYDKDGYLDTVYVQWTGPDGTSKGIDFWWAYLNFWKTNPTFKVDGKKFNKYVWSWYTNDDKNSPNDSIRTIIHETGHALGLCDYYDCTAGELDGPEGGVGKLDMMDNNWGDHNCFSKFMMGWIKPKIISLGSHTLTLRPSGTAEDAVLIMPNASPNPFGEFFMVQYRKKGSGNDPLNYHGTDTKLGFNDYPADGLLIWHVDATLTTDGNYFLYNNSETKHNMLRLMEADGGDHISYGLKASAGDFYTPSHTFGPFTNPNSKNYSNNHTGISVIPSSSPGNTMTVKLTFFSGDYSLALATDNQDLEWSSNGPQSYMGDGKWFYQTLFKHDGWDSAQSGRVLGGQASEISTKVYGPGTLRFCWYLQGKYLGFFDNGNIVTYLLGDNSNDFNTWQQVEYTVDAGEHTFIWLYYQNPMFGAYGLDLANLDQVEWVPGDDSPPILSANIVGGTYKQEKIVSLYSTEDEDIYYTTDGSSPTIQSAKYNAPLNITTDMILSFISRDLAGNYSQVYTENYIIDKKTPTASVNLGGGLYNRDQILYLDMSEIGTIYYTLDNTNPTIFSNKYVSPIKITKNTILKFIAVDMAGNPSIIYKQTYNIDKIAPKASATPRGGYFKVNQRVYLQMNEAGNIYYTLNNSTPTTSSAKYTYPLSITSTKTLKFMAVDKAGNKSLIYVQNYVIDKIAPKVLLTSPSSNKTGYSQTNDIYVKFTEKILASANWNYIKIKNLKTNKYLSVTKTITNNVLTLHTTLRTISTWYQVIIPQAAVQDQARNSIVSIYTFIFKTGT